MLFSAVEHIQVRGNVLSVSREREEQKDEKGKTFHRVKRHYGKFQRDVTLPCEVQETRSMRSTAYAS